jgi:hypothetical protein
MLGCVGPTHDADVSLSSSLNDGHDDDGDGFTEHEDE